MKLQIRALGKEGLDYVRDHARRLDLPVHERAVVGEYPIRDVPSFWVFTDRLAEAAISKWRPDLLGVARHLIVVIWPDLSILEQGDVLADAARAGIPFFTLGTLTK